MLSSRAKEPMVIKINETPKSFAVGSPVNSLLKNSRTRIGLNSDPRNLLPEINDKAKFA
jgi:hypothetical protein